MRIVNSGKVYRLMVELDRLRFVEQHADAHPFQSGEHADSVVIS
jgi:hypothetical protein